MSWFLLCLKKFASFSGRARRKEFWYFTLFFIIVLFMILLLFDILELFIGQINDTIPGLIMLIFIVPALAVKVRRLHDIGKSGAWIFLSMIPLVGDIWILIYLLTPGQPFENQYGADPKESMETYHQEIMKQHSGNRGKWKPLFSVLLAFVLLGILYSVHDSLSKEINNSHKSDYTAADQFKLSFPQDWELDEGAHSYDLYCVSGGEDLGTGVFVYNKKDLPQDSHADDMLKDQIDTMKSDVTNIHLIETKKDTITKRKRIKTVVYSGKIAFTEYYFILSVVDFKQHDPYVVIVQACLPYDFERNEALLADIVSSCKKLP